MLGVPDSKPEVSHDDADKDGRNEAAEVGADAAEGESEVHALAEQRVQPHADPSTQVTLQSVQELPDLRRGDEGSE